MRILVISNLYPPHYLGGYELACHDVSEALRSRGHEVRVLTSTYGVDHPRSDRHVYRRLELNLDFKSGLFDSATGTLIRKEQNSQKVLREVIKDLAPDVAFFWNMWGLSLSLAAVVDQVGVPVCFYVSDDWLAEWSGETDPWVNLWLRPPNLMISKVAKPLLKRVLSMVDTETYPVRFEDCYFAFASRFVQDTAVLTGKALKHTVVISHGVDTTRFPYKPSRQGNPTRLVYVGRLVPEKGVHIAIEAMRILRDEYGCKSLTLDVVGTGLLPEYVQSLYEMVQNANLGETVRFVGFVPREDLTKIYGEHDILVFPSCWNEPFSIVMLEAMSSGLVVVGTATGGSAEIVENEHSGLTFAKDNAQECAAQVFRLLCNPELFERLRQNSRNTVERWFTFDGMVGTIEQWLRSVVFKSNDTEHVQP